MNERSALTRHASCTAQQPAQKTEIECDVSGSVPARRKKHTTNNNRKGEEVELGALHVPQVHDSKNIVKK